MSKTIALQGKIAQQEGVVVLESLANQNVIEANRLIEATAKMSVNSLKIFEIAVSGVDSQSEHPSSKIKINRDELYKVLNLNDNNHRSSQLNKILKSLLTESVFSYSYIDKNGEHHDINIVPINWTENAKGYVTIKFQDEIMPYISTLKRNFTRYQLNDILRLTNRYAVVLYRWLIMHYRKYEYYATKHQRTDNQLGEYHNPQISIADLRNLCNVENKYRYYKDLDSYVIKPAIKQITELTNYNLTYEKIKKGRPVVALKFNINVKNEQLLTNPLDTSLLIENAQSPVLADITTFMNNEFVQLMIGAHLIDISEVMQNADYRSQILTLVPKYQSFAQKYGDSALRQHLNYVGKHLPQYIVSIADYLNQALNNYQGKKELAVQKPKRSKRQYGKRANIKEELPDWAAHPEKIKDKKPSKEAVAQVKTIIDEFNRNYGSGKLHQAESKPESPLKPISETPKNNADQATEDPRIKEFFAGMDACSKLRDIVDNHANSQLTSDEIRLIKSMGIRADKQRLQQYLQEHI